MVALCNRADHYIFALWFLSFFFCLMSAAADWMSAILHTWCGLSANIRCRSETCCTRLAENTGRKKVAKNRHLGTIPQLCRAISSQIRHVSTIGKKHVKQQYVLHTSPQYGELRTWWWWWSCCQTDSIKALKMTLNTDYEHVKWPQWTSFFP